MAPERWSDVERIYHAALSHDPTEREVFLATACAGDEALRREVGSMLASEQAAAGFMSTPAFESGMLSPAASFVGRQLGPYVIQSPLGAGGMGEVYRARDRKLGRDVAIKILPRIFTNDRDRLVRFEREARLLASLNHPNIGTIYGLEEVDGIPALVLELVEGDTLADRLARRGRAVSGSPKPRNPHGSGLALDEALPIARQITDALEAAHEKGIVHRDLKPANIKITAAGVVKVLDFGLAKFGSGRAGRAGEAGRADSAGGTGAHALTNSPTVMSGTREGVILGTAAYMSPEQAQGQDVDARSDIWAFGVVLYEMLTGKSGFDGETTVEVLSNVLKTDPDWTALPLDLPAAVRRLLRRCLEKNPKRRLSAIGDARLELDEAGEPADRDGVLAASPLAASVVPAWRRALPWTVVGIFGLGMVSALLIWSPRRSSPVPTPRILLASIGVAASLPTDHGASAILSPDGTTLAFVGQQSGQTRLFIRKLEQLQAAALDGTEGAASPFFSPNGQWIAFFANLKLKKVSVTGGATINLSDAPSGFGGAWIDDDTIIFTPAIAYSALMRVSSRGGTATAFGTLSKGAGTQRWPQALPGGKGVLYTEYSGVDSLDDANLVVAPLSSGTPTIVVRGGYYGRYVPSGHLVYMRQGRLFVVRFDLDHVVTTGRAIPAFEGVIANSNRTGGAQLAFSSEGTLVYVPSVATTPANSTEWMTRDGKRSVLRAAKADWGSPRFSPDGQKLAFEIFDGKQHDIWVYEWARDTLTQLTFDAASDRWPVWTPDGRRIVFASDRVKPGRYDLYWVNADGTGDVTRLTEGLDGAPWSWHPSGKFLAFMVTGGTSQTDLMILPMEGDAARGWRPGKPTVFLSTPANEGFPAFSPDGRWIAYFSNESGDGTYDVYVRPFPGPGGKWRVSTGGGRFPTWSTTTHELLFVNRSGTMMFAPYAVVGDSFRADTPQIWAPTNIRGMTPGNSAFDLHPDGKRLAVLPTQDQNSLIQDKVVFVFNFFDYLRTIAPGRD